MRPEILFSLFTPVTGLDGIGPRLAKLVEKLAGPRVVDLLWHLPSGVIDRSMAPTLAEAIPGGIVTVTITVDQHNKPHNKRQPYRITCHDQTGLLTLVFFHAREDYLTRLLPIGETRVVSGRLESYGDDLQMVHPDHVVTLAEAEDLPRIEPVYPMTEGLTPKTLRKAIAGALERMPDLPEWQDAAYLAQRGWPQWRTAVETAHAPADPIDLERRALPRERLAFDELLANQLALALVRASQKRAKGLPVVGDGSLRKAVADALPFTMTASQDQAIGEILEDMASDERMLRLLQGDVGSGKTLVALMAMLTAVETGRQAALLAPTELLARQHHATLTGMAEAAGVEVVLLTGRDKGKARAAKLERLASGEAQLAVGTHTLIQDDVLFDNLALVVIDEQHRFGVHQRLALTGKGRGVHVLVMTATPIPRTL
ncbi:MAG: DEAD/DEAH box helicase, partial [Rhodospirillaceae bacterium]|nr:DEAD/DEAH box helicase [Rhodospirillaceae bacterium]